MARCLSALPPTPSFLEKLKGVPGAAPPPPASLQVALANSAGAGCGMLVLYVMHEYLSSAASMVVASIGSSAILLYCTPAAPFSQPRNVIGGHLVSCAAGLALRQVPVLAEHDFLLAPSALCGAVALMSLTGTVHPPAGATALIATHNPLGLFFLLPVCFGAVGVVSTALVFNNVMPGRRYPQYW